MKHTPKGQMNFNNVKFDVCAILCPTMCMQSRKIKETVHIPFEFKDLTSVIFKATKSIGRIIQ